MAGDVSPPGGSTPQTAITVDPVVTTTMFDPAEQAAWDIAVSRGLNIGAADVRAMLAAAAAHQQFAPFADAVQEIRRIAQELGRQQGRAAQLAADKQLAEDVRALYLAPGDDEQLSGMVPFAGLLDGQADTT